MNISNFFKTYDEYKKVAELLLTNGTDPNLVNSKEFTPLQIICMGNRDDFNLAKKLFKLRNDTYKPEQINVRDEHGWTPLHEALSRGHKKLFELLLRNGADPNLATDLGSTQLHTICDRDRDDYDLAKMLFELSHNRLKVNTIDQLNQTPPYLTLSRGHRKLVELLLINGADSNAVDKYGDTPLHIVTKKHVCEDNI
uniref:Uncharacterized protein n=1 Tax=Trichogramma kaykai TaxID=54128 RepID=A0ABD2WMD3_9HYME